jgi:nicotinate-nucleotide adenylyltransferase
MGLYGGAFDPPHAGHLALVQAALHELVLDRLFIVPTGQPPHRKPTQTPDFHRLNMLRLAVNTLPLCDREKISIDEQEMRRSGPSYTAYTVNELYQREPQAQLWLILGADQWNALNTWHDVDRWRQRVRICVAQRAPWQIKAEPEPDHVLHLPPLPYGSSHIRQALVKKAPGFQGMPGGLAPAVRHYIEDRQLYTDFDSRLSLP